MNRPPLRAPGVSPGPPLLLLYGLDGDTLPLDAVDTREMTRRAVEVLRARGWRVATSQVGRDLSAALDPFPPGEWLVFNLCEGSPRQAFYYAAVARELERRGYAYTGSGAAALHETQFKPSMKTILEANGIPTPRWAQVAETETADSLYFDAFPAIVKPAGEHCSFGITRESVVSNLSEARAQAAAVLRDYRGGAIIEEFLDSEEYAVALWGEEDAMDVLGISVIRYDGFADRRDRLCTFEAKWLPETDAYLKTMPTCPAPLPRRRADELGDLAVRAHRACGLRDYSRVDFRLRHGQPLVLDVNSNCGLSESAGFANTARVAGWDYGALLEHLVLMAAARGNRRPEGVMA
jgi:D-alanine-D-alanine ligase